MYWILKCNFCQILIVWLLLIANVGCYHLQKKKLLLLLTNMFSNNRLGKCCKSVPLFLWSCKQVTQFYHCFTVLWIHGKKRVDVECKPCDRIFFFHFNKFFWFLIFCWKVWCLTEWHLITFFARNRRHRIWKFRF